MKYSIYLFIIFHLFSCTIKKSPNNILTDNKVSKTISAINIVDSLTMEECIIVNTLLQLQLESDRYKNTRKNEILLIKESINPLVALNAYDYAYKERKSSVSSRLLLNPNSLDDEDGWVIDSLKIDRLKIKYNNDEVYNWKESDVKNYKISIINSKTFINIIKSGSYINFPEKLVLYVSKPLIINKEYALIFFNSGNSQFGFNTIERFTVLMKKIEGKWVKDIYYYDGTYN